MPEKPARCPGRFIGSFKTAYLSHNTPALIMRACRFLKPHCIGFGFCYFLFFKCKLILEFSLVSPATVSRVFNTPLSGCLCQRSSRGFLGGISDGAFVLEGHCSNWEFLACTAIKLFASSVNSRLKHVWQGFPYTFTYVCYDAMRLSQRIDSHYIVIMLLQTQERKVLVQCFFSSCFVVFLLHCTRDAVAKPTRLTKSFKWRLPRFEVLMLSDS